MAGSILGDIGSRFAPDNVPTPGRTDEAKNNAGGFTFTLDKWARLERFLILGVDSGTFYVKARDLAIDNADVVQECLDEDYTRTIDTAVEISVSGRAANNDPALFVIACGASSGDKAARAYSLSKLNDVARIGTHLFHFVRFVQSRRGWGRQLTKAIARWYEAKDADAVAYQAVKYRQRDGWSHRDVLRKAHPAAPTAQHAAVYDTICGRKTDVDEIPKVLTGFLKMQEAPNADEAAALVREYNLPWETVPSDFLKGDKVWRALVETPGALPLGALIRNLGVLTNRGVIAPGALATAEIAERIVDIDAIRRARIHPIAVLNAMVTYTKGTSRGDVTWSSVPLIANALDAAFYASFGNVESTGKRTMLAIDLSGSMDWYPCTGAAFTPRVGAAAMAMVTEAVEDNVIVTGFTGGARSLNGIGGLSILDVTSKRRLDDNLAYIDRQRAGGTDCSLPMLWAASNEVEVDAFIVLTDNETWSGKMKPFQALRQYRQRTGINAKLIVVGMTATGFTIADPKDAGMLDVVGFDTATPQMMSEFARS